MARPPRVVVGSLALSIVFPHHEESRRYRSVPHFQRVVGVGNGAGRTPRQPHLASSEAMHCNAARSGESNCGALVTSRSHVPVALLPPPMPTPHPGRVDLLRRRVDQDPEHARCRPCLAGHEATDLNGMRPARQSNRQRPCSEPWSALPGPTRRGL